MKWSLGPTRELLKVLGNPETHFNSIHIGGTNGKGSVAMMVAEAMRHAGHRVGLYTSPHLVDVRERISVDAQPIPVDAFCSWTEYLADSIERTSASFFESTTAIAFADFAARGAEIAVIEVGLGGRLDSTNVIEPMVSCVTSVSLEHTAYLGDSLESIAREKAGIAKAGRPFVIGESDPAVVRTLYTAAERSGAQVHVVEAGSIYEGPLGMHGWPQRRNAAVAQAVLSVVPERLRPSRLALAESFATAWLPGRFDQRGRWLFDVAHNASAVSVLANDIREANLCRPIHALVGMLSDKDWETVLKTLRPEVDAMWISTPPSAPLDRRTDLSWVQQQYAALDLKVEADFDRALEGAEHGAGTVLVTGSFHTVGDVMSRLPGFAPLG